MSFHNCTFPRAITARGILDGHILPVRLCRITTKPILLPTRDLQVNALALLLAICFACFMPASGAQAAEPEVYDQEVVAFLAQGWAAFYRNQPTAAIQTVGQLTHSKNNSTRWHALHIQARSLWSTGDQANQRKALEIWSRVGRECRGNPFATARVEIGKALYASEAGKLPQAIETLEKFRQQKLPSAATVEAAIELALFYAQAKRPADATKQLDAAGDILKYSESNGIPGVMHNALFRGVEQARESVQNPGRSLFNRAKGQQREGKHANALTMFIQVSRDYPESDYAYRSQFEIGICHQNMGKSHLAIEQWRRFIASAPAGPWRGQAFTALIDLYLVEQLDIQEASTYSELARTSLPQGLEQAKSQASWQAQAYEIHLRVGIVNFCLGRNAIAAEAFEQAKSLTKQKVYIERLDSLVEAVKAKQPIIPADCVTDSSAGSRKSSVTNDSGLSKPALALSLGMIHLLTGERDLANDYFDRILGTPAVAEKPGSAALPAKPGLSDATAAQQSFAVFGKGAVLQARRDKDARAKQLFIASIKAYKDGSWHDETLYRIAVLTEQLAFDQFGRGEPTDKERLANFANAKAEALPFWQQITQKYPKSQRMEVALYEAGVLLNEHAEIAAYDKALAIYKEASVAFKRLCESYPQSHYAGDAYVRQVDIALEKMFDIRTAAAIAQQGLLWAKICTESNDLSVYTNTNLPLWMASQGHPTRNQLLTSAHDCFVRSGFIAYMQQEPDTALNYFKSARLALEKMNLRPNNKTNKIPLFAMRVIITAIQRQSPITDPLLFEEKLTTHQHAAIQLADLYLRAWQPEKAENLYRKILSGENGIETPQNALQAYTIIRLAESLNNQRNEWREAIELLTIFEGRKFEGSYWGGFGLFRLAVTTYNNTQDAEKSLEQYGNFFRRYPNHPLAELAHAYFCLNAIRAGHTITAKNAFTDFQNKYKNSKWVPTIQEVLNEKNNEKK